jgi:ACT domain-containing protein
MEKKLRKIVQELSDNKPSRKINESNESKQIANSLSRKYRDIVQNLLDEMEQDEKVLLQQIRSDGDRDYGKLGQFRRVMSKTRDLFITIDRILDIRSLQ